MRESTIEKYLVQRVKLAHGMAIKLGGYIGIPDRLLILPGGVFIFVELKTATGKLSALQHKWRSLLVELGCNHQIIRSKEEINLLLSPYVSLNL